MIKIYPVMTICAKVYNHNNCKLQKTEGSMKSVLIKKKWSGLYAVEWIIRGLKIDIIREIITLFCQDKKQLEAFGKMKQKVV